MQFATGVAAPARPSVLEWDGRRIAQEHATFLRVEEPGLSEDEAFARACEDTLIYEVEWEHLIACLGELVCTMESRGRFHVEGRNLGWRQRSGRKTFCADDARTFPQELLRDADCTFTIAHETKALHIINYHHDAPAGNFYTVTPAGVEE